MDGAVPPLVRDAATRVTRLETIFELAPVGIGIVDLEGRTTMTNDLLRRSLGFTADEFATMTFSEFTHPDDAAANLRLFGQMMSGSLDQFSMEKRFIGKGGQIVWADLTVSLVRDLAGAPDYAIGMTQDITERKRLESELRAAEEGYRLLVERVPAVVYAAEPGPMGCWDYVSPQIEGMLGFTAHEWLAEPGAWMRQLDPRDHAAVLEHERAIVENRSAIESTDTYRLRHRDGTTVWVRDDATLLWGADGRAVFHGVLVDVTREKQLEERLAHEVVHDPLTGLPNRRLFHDRVGHALLAAARSGDAVVVLFIDLDDFKTINDTFGHAAGDEVIGAVARRLQMCARAGDTAARLGGDEFAVLVENLDADRAVALADRILAQLRDTPVEFSGHTAVVGASIGIAVAARGDTTETLLRNADLAMYRAKTQGRGRLALYDPALHVEAASRFRLDWSRHAPAADAITLVFQPIVDLRTGEVAGLEAVAHRSDPVLADPSSGEYLAAVERAGRRGGVGARALRKSCEALVSWRAATGRDAYLSVRVSALQLELDGFATATLLTLGEHGLGPADLVLFVAEDPRLEGVGRDALRALRSAGVRIALDGFGSGRSSLSSLRSLPADLVRFDGSALRAAPGDPEEPALLQAVVRLVQGLRLESICEGVTTLDQLVELRTTGCEFGQGTLLGAPGPIEGIPGTIPLLGDLDRCRPA